MCNPITTSLATSCKSLATLYNKLQQHLWGIYYASNSVTSNLISGLVERDLIIIIKAECYSIALWLDDRCDNGCCAPGPLSDNSAAAQSDWLYCHSYNYRSCSCCLPVPCMPSDGMYMSTPTCTCTCTCVGLGMWPWHGKEFMHQQFLHACIISDAAYSMLFIFVRGEYQVNWRPFCANGIDICMGNFQRYACFNRGTAIAKISSM